jgi:hypothetical protein
MKAKLGNVNLVIWGIKDFKHNVVPLYMAQMAYVEVALNIDMDCSTMPLRSQTHMKPKILQRTLWLIETHPIDPFEPSKYYHPWCSLPLMYVLMKMPMMMK